MTILIICVYVLTRKKHAEIYLPSTFQTLDIELLSPKIDNILLTKSPMCLYMCQAETVCIVVNEENFKVTL